MRIIFSLFYCCVDGPHVMCWWSAPLVRRLNTNAICRRKICVRWLFGRVIQLKV